MTYINMNRINAVRTNAVPRDSVAWGKDANCVATATKGSISALVFAAVLIVCSVTVGCSSDKPKPVSSNNQISMTAPQPAPASMPAPVLQAENKPAPKKAVHRKPATVNYADKTYGVTFEYPRRYAIETGDAAANLLLSSPIPMNFVQPGGVALAAVELPETGFANTDFDSAFFNVSVHKTLTADQCNEFAVPQPKEVVTSEIVTSSSTTNPATPATSETPKQDATNAAKPDAQPMPTSATTANANSQSVSVSQLCHPEDGTSCGPKDPTTTSAATAVGNSTSNTNLSTADSTPKLLVGDLELRATEAVSGEGTRQSDSKYFHVFQNGACYEFALNVTTDATDSGLVKHVDRDKVFSRLEQILATVKISPVVPEVTADAPVTPVAPASPAQ
jgi:hypothetical protein